MHSGRRADRKRQWLLTCLLALCLLVIGPGAAWAHPLGNFTVNHYSRLDVGDKQVELLYIIDMAEIPTQQEITQIDSNRDGQMSDAEQAGYLAQQLQKLPVQLLLQVNGALLTWQVTEKSLEFPPGQADLPTLRLTAHLVAELPKAELWQAVYTDNHDVDRIGWQEIVVRAAPSAKLLESSVADQDQSQELRQYPDGLLQSPLRLTTASFRFAPAVLGEDNAPSSQPVLQSAVAATSELAKSNDRFAELIAIPTLGPGAIFLALLAAFGWGALHALSPGHGKTIVAAYLVGSRGTARHALFLGLTTTVTHTAGVFALGLLTLFASRYVLPETLYPWLGFLSGLLVVGIGLSLVWGRLRGLLGFATHGHHHDHHPHDHSHDHDHDHHHDHDHAQGHSHSHLPPGGDGAPVTWRSLLALGVSGGLLPCPSALVLMLGAIALDRVGFGLLLILIFSVGLASVLTAIGIALVYAGKLVDRIPEGGRLLRVMPVASAAFITVVGALITWQALVETGVLGMG
jgi:ABC-type nickel/cobalt efflux system permease component RcnA